MEALPQRRIGRVLGAERGARRSCRTTRSARRPAWPRAIPSTTPTSRPPRPGCGRRWRARATPRPAGRARPVTRGRRRQRGAGGVARASRPGPQPVRAGGGRRPGRRRRWPAWRPGPAAVLDRDQLADDVRALRSALHARRLPACPGGRAAGARRPAGEARWSSRCTVGPRMPAPVPRQRDAPRADAAGAADGARAGPAARRHRPRRARWSGCAPSTARTASPPPGSRSRRCPGGRTWPWSSGCWRGRATASPPSASRGRQRPPRAPGCASGWWRSWPRTSRSSRRPRRTRPGCWPPRSRASAPRRRAPPPLPAGRVLRGGELGPGRGADRGGAPGRGVPGGDRPRHLGGARRRRGAPWRSRYGFREGPRTTVEAVEFEGNQALSLGGAAGAAAPRRRATRWSTPAWRRPARPSLRRYAARGRVFARVEPRRRDRSPSGTRPRVRYRIDEGPEVHVGRGSW